MQQIVVFANTMFQPTTLPKSLFPSKFIAATNGALEPEWMYVTMGVLIPLESLKLNTRPGSLYGHSVKNPSVSTLCHEPSTPDDPGTNWMPLNPTAPVKVSETWALSETTVKTPFSLTVQAYCPVR